MPDNKVITLTVTRTETYTIETTEADIRAKCREQNVAEEGQDLDKVLSAMRRYPTYSEELVLSALAAGQTDPDGESWELDDWETDDDE